MILLNDALFGKDNGWVLEWELLAFMCVCFGRGVVGWRYTFLVTEGEREVIVVREMIFISRYVVCVVFLCACVLCVPFWLSLCVVCGGRAVLTIFCGCVERLAGPLGGPFVYVWM